MSILLSQTELNKKSSYGQHYDPNKLFAIPRQLNREKIGITDKLPFYGLDRWNHYEVSWLNKKGKPMVGLGIIEYDASSTNIIESKSMKLYFNSFNGTQISDVEELKSIICHDIELRIGSNVSVNILLIDQFTTSSIVSGFEGISIDLLDIECSEYILNPALLSTKAQQVKETVYSNLLKSNCLVTGQPDWGSVRISYEGNKINHESLLRYIVSFRDCNEFSETCIERIFMDILAQCHSKVLTVEGQFTRRGGLDVNPIRSTHLEYVKPSKVRFCRQ